MKKTTGILLVLVVIVLFSTVKLLVPLPTVDLSFVEIILTVSSILFGLLVSFFISELWSRYTEIRELQGVRSSQEQNMIRYASYFFSNKKFEKEFKDRVELSAIIDEAIEWDEGHLEIPYFRDIESSFTHIKVKTSKDSEYFDNMLDSYNSLVESMVRLDTLYKERLFWNEWVVLYALSAVITISLLILPITGIFSQAIILIFPAVIALALSIVHDLNTLSAGMEIITLEPIQKALEAIGRKRFYTKRDIKYVAKGITDYRTEDDLKGTLKKEYQKIIKAREEK